MHYEIKFILYFCHMKREIDTSLLDRAIIYAVHAHQGVERSGKGFPYIVHWQQLFCTMLLRILLLPLMSSARSLVNV